ncbi:DEAD/DEAH box helicase [Mycobacterium koreense]|uniref:Helicase n=1 Tax=Mycolicibacillus koreensis TaxID=1069220 RepID=A0A7I7SCF6_9MYCO|nr:DEAD/DEAH box helicase [Mycolicibacillus koreensis]MCV7249078.1 DEAD/DEAH box helicase [Mycolicibacillus koreensis]OSC34127.1 helicase [Mycolicibacillus koreensis]BBY54592.1 helicase [Mycolicibacillus koreensis]
MGSVHEVVEAFRDAPSNSERGTKFEQLMVRYFQLDPMLSQQYDQVWRWIDWPGRQGKTDTGIDLVARERDTGNYTAIQCKFYEPTHRLAKEDIDSFFTASGKEPFTNRVIISTTDRWGKNAEDALEGQTKPVQRIGMAEIADSPIDWDIAWPAGDLHIELAPAQKHQARPHQEQAIDAAFGGFAAGNDRGKLIMACGTGKTFTALKIAERTAAENGGAARILFLVPSISLLSQTLRAWTAQTELDLRAFAVCSDTKVSRTVEDYNVHDVPIPVTTDPQRLADEMAYRKRAKGLTVVFSTYQSLPVVAEAQKLGVDEFDLVICDEAHRTTGVTLAGDDESNFVRIHDADYLHASRRLYMTATPRIFAESVKDKAAQHSAELATMDNELTYGPEFHRLSFGDAVERGLLTDYKVLVLTIDESVIAPKLQQQFAAVDGELSLDDASKLIGCWNGLAKRAGTAPDGTGFAPGETPMRRAVAFARDIKSSKQVAEMFPVVVSRYQELLNEHENDGQRVEATNRGLTCAVHHVDGTYNALERNAELTWLKGVVAEDECRILTNARCLSEGVDVPALDAVLFLHPRNSQVDVVQSVGRVMRKADAKEYGYVILPVAVPQGVEPSAALDDNQRFKVVWQVLNALRSHDERFDAMVNSIALNSESNKKGGVGTDKLLGAHIGPTLDDLGDGTAADDEAESLRQMALFSLSAWQEAIYARIVDKVGTRTYWEQWASDVADIAAALVTRITASLDGADTKTAEAFGQFVRGLCDNLNDSITEADAISMLAQHLITRPVFDALFAGHDFASHNPISKTMQKMLDTLGGTGLEAETAKLEGFYESVRRRASEVTSAEGKQQVIAELYEKFFRIGFKKQAEALGIVYTPTQIVDFILRAADAVSRKHFSRGLTDEGVHILDGFTGTGTFMTRLLESGLITAKDLQRKYSTELHANEIMLLAYYIAAVNIETTYHALAGKTAGVDDYEPFPGIVLADTFQISEAGDSMDRIMFPHNNARIEAQLETPINVIIGNPPYSVGQTSANDLNANVEYPTLDRRIENTYAKRSTATNKNSLYDSYIRAFRWATDRIGKAGVVGFVSNGGWIDGNTADGMRLSLADDYSAVYVYNLRGNMRKTNWKEEGGQIFGAGSQATVAVFIGIKDAAHTGPCMVFYRDIGDYLTREDKLRIVNESQVDAMDWQTISPNAEGDWINQRDGAYSSWPAIGEKKSPGVMTVFGTYSSGLKTGRDTWCDNFSRAGLDANIAELVNQYQAVGSAFHREFCGSKPSEQDVTKFLQAHSEFTADGQISWNRSLKQYLAKNTVIERSDDRVRLGTYRPFQRQWTYFDRRVNDMVYQLPSMFPTPHHENSGILVLAPRDGMQFATLATDLLPDLSFFTYTAQFFPRWTYEKAESDDGGLDFAAVSGEVDKYGYRRVDNITDGILKLYRDAIGDQVTKDDIFYYVYGLLHDPAYREKYAADLKKMLPHIPTPESRERFSQFADAGRKLAKLHVNYESAEPYLLDVQLKAGAKPEDRETWRVEKMKWKSKTDHSAIIYNGKVTLAGIPEDAERYMLGSRSALAWLIDRYQVKTDKASGIVNDPNDWCDEHDAPTYIVDLIKKVTTVSVETMKIVDQLSATTPTS